MKKINVRIGGVRTSATINEHVLNLAAYLDGQPDVQELIDTAIDDYGMEPGKNVSSWITSLISVAASKQLEEWGNRI